MIIPNKLLACHHIKLQKNCRWCKSYEQQSVNQCDRCGMLDKTNEVFLSRTDKRPELICYNCHYREVYGGKYANS